MLIMVILIAVVVIVVVIIVMTILVIIIIHHPRYWTSICWLQFVGLNSLTSMHESMCASMHKENYPSKAPNSSCAWILMQICPRLPIWTSTRIPVSGALRGSLYDLHVDPDPDPSNDPQIDH